MNEGGDALFADAGLAGEEDVERSLREALGELAPEILHCERAVGDVDPGVALRGGCIVDRDVAVFAATDRDGAAVGERMGADTTRREDHQEPLHDSRRSRFRLCASREPWDRGYARYRGVLYSREPGSTSLARIDVRSTIASQFMLRGLMLLFTRYGPCSQQGSPYDAPLH
ncbi:MAG: hypothetical protein BGO98_01255 [Myxococcales bacterium 68-20]|nr:MAG: hypothetical protein BGO98_01255 [Myxococcales bacterium 68-20]